jgi:hypothetical protein
MPQGIVSSLRETSIVMPQGAVFSLELPWGGKQFLGETSVGMPWELFPPQSYPKEENNSLGKHLL